MKPCKVYSIQENDVIVPETDYYEVVHFDMKEPHVIRSSDGNKPLLVENEVHCTPIRQFSEISEFGTRINTYVAFDKKLEDYVNLLIKEREDELKSKYNLEIEKSDRVYKSLLRTYARLTTRHVQQREAFMKKWNSHLHNLLLGGISVVIGVSVILLGKVYF